MCLNGLSLGKQGFVRLFRMLFISWRNERFPFANLTSLDIKVVPYLMVKRYMSRYLFSNSLYSRVDVSSPSSK